jgi:hypothetical protein
MKFPILKENQVAVVMADGATGHVFNDKGEIFRNDSKDNIYLLFDTIEIAKDFIQKQSILNEKTEFLIYDKNNLVLEYVKAIYWK